MKLVRLALATAIGASSLLAVQANAAPKPCKLVTDDAGDAKFHAGQGPGSNALDLTSADVAADKKRVTVVARVVKLVANDPTSAPTGMSWRVSFTVDKQVLSMNATADPTGAVTYSAAYVDSTGINRTYAGGGVTGVFDVAKSEIRMTAEHSLFATHATIKTGTQLTALGATSGRIVNAVAVSFTPTSDSATSDKTYVVGAKSCVVVNK